MFQYEGIPPEWWTDNRRWGVADVFRYTYDTIHDTFPMWKANRLDKFLPKEYLKSENPKPWSKMKRVTSFFEREIGKIQLGLVDIDIPLRQKPGTEGLHVYEFNVDHPEWKVTKKTNKTTRIIKQKSRCGEEEHPIPVSITSLSILSGTFSKIWRWDEDGYPNGDVQSMMKWIIEGCGVVWLSARNHYNLTQALKPILKEFKLDSSANSKDIAHMIMNKQDDLRERYIDFAKGAEYDNFKIKFYPLNYKIFNHANKEVCGGNTNKSFLHGEWFDRIAKTDGNITK